MASIAKAAGRGEAGCLTIGFYTSLSAGNLRATLGEYRRRYPNVEIRVVQESRERLTIAIMSCVIDIAVVTGELKSRGGATLSLWSERIIVALPKMHPLADRDIVYWTDLKRETFLLTRLDLGQDFRDFLMTKLSMPGDGPVIVQYEVDGETVKSLVGAGLGVSLTCDAYLGVNYSGVVYREARDGSGPSWIGYSAHWAQDNGNPALASFLKLLRERYPALPNTE